jgi:hypothetical protein
MHNGCPHGHPHPPATGQLEQYTSQPHTTAAYTSRLEKSKQTQAPPWPGPAPSTANLGPPYFPPDPISCPTMATTCQYLAAQRSTQLLSPTLREPSL